MNKNQIINEFKDIGKIKADRKWTDTFLLAILAGAFIALGAYASLLVRIDTPIGIAKFFAGVVFSSGLIMITFTGAELFTGNVLMIFSILFKKINFYKMLKNWIIVYFGNLLGAVFIAFCVLLCLKPSPEYLNLALQTATSKLELNTLNCFISGIFCNWLVCMAVYMAQCAKNIQGKIFGIIFPITIFVIAGYEHCVANMFFIPNGIFAQYFLQNDFGLTFSAFIKNIIPVTFGNIFGAFIFVVLPLWKVYKK